MKKLTLILLSTTLIGCYKTEKLDINNCQLWQGTQAQYNIEFSEGHSYTDFIIITDAFK